MIDRKELEELRELLLNHCHKMSILRGDAEEKKKKAILDSLVVSVINTGLTLREVKECVSDIERDKVINLDFFEKGKNLFDDYIKQKWKLFAKELFSQRSIGLGTPNAASGEAELMFLFLSKQIKKPTKGDLDINGEIIELKGDRVRVMGKIRGTDFRQKTIELCKEFNLIPNKSNKIELDVVEIEKAQHLHHWKKQLSGLQLPEQKDFINKWLKCIDGKNHNDSVERIFRQGLFNYSIFVKEIIKILYSTTAETGNFDKFIMLGDGTNAIIIKDINDFNKKLDDGEIVPQGDYFRINQPYNIGWYVSAS